MILKSNIATAIFQEKLRAEINTTKHLQILSTQGYLDANYSDKQLILCEKIINQAILQRFHLSQ